MKRLALILVNTVLLSACAQMTDVRVARLPEPPVITMPVTKLDSISEQSSDEEVAAAYYDAVVRLRGALQEAINALSVYRTP